MDTFSWVMLSLCIYCGFMVWSFADFIENIDDPEDVMASGIMAVFWPVTWFCIGGSWMFHKYQERRIRRRM